MILPPGNAGGRGDHLEEDAVAKKGVTSTGGPGEMEPRRIDS
jgi:hypothetical protein